MDESTLIKRIMQKNTDIDQIAEDVLENPKLISVLIEGLDSDRNRIRFGSEKLLRLLSEQKPELVYPHFDVFVDMLDSDNKIIRWGATRIIGNLAMVDSKKRFDKIFSRYFGLIAGPDMITAANVFKSSALIARARPDLVDAITKEVLKVEKATYRKKGHESPECGHVAAGHAIDSLGHFYEKIKNKKTVLKFVRKQLKNPRRSTVDKAESFIEKVGTN